MTVNEIRERLAAGEFDGSEEAVRFLLMEVDLARASAMGYAAVAIEEGICFADECDDVLQWRRERIEAGLWEGGALDDAESPDGASEAEGEGLEDEEGGLDD